MAHEKKKKRTKKRKRTRTTKKHIGFVSTRFAGSDGVSLESAKWAKILWDYQHVSYWFAGKLDRKENISMEEPEAFFGHPENLWINERVFGRHTRSKEVTDKILALATKLRDALYEFVDCFDIDILLVQNALCIPMHVPLGVALTQFISETGFPTIAHHHDFYWERPRFRVNSVHDFLDMSFPPSLPSIQHVTINSYAQQQLAWRKGSGSLMVPNVLDFEGPPPVADDYSSDFRHDIGLRDDDILVLQPTRVVPRKGIEHAIDLLARIDDPRYKLVISHESGDEGERYQMNLKDQAERRNVDLRFISARVGDTRSTGEKGQKIYDLRDAYANADLVTYTSLYEGFGNALVETFYFRKPVLVNRYSIFISDIEPKGFKVVKMDGFITKEVVEQTRRIVEDEEHRRAVVEFNYEQCKAFYSYSVLRRNLRTLITTFTGLDEL